MKTTLANEIRKQYLELITKILNENQEEVGQIATNAVNFPVVKDDVEGWVEIVIKVPKYEDDEGYAKREEFEIKTKLKEEKEIEKEEKKKKKIEHDKKMREQKKLEKIAKMR